MEGVTEVSDAGDDKLLWGAATPIRRGAGGFHGALNIAALLAHFWQMDLCQKHPLQLFRANSNLAAQQEGGGDQLPSLVPSQHTLCSPVLLPLACSWCWGAPQLPPLGLSLLSLARGAALLGRRGTWQEGWEVSSFPTQLSKEVGQEGERAGLCLWSHPAERGGGGMGHSPALLSPGRGGRQIPGGGRGGGVSVSAHGEGNSPRAAGWAPS